jgi:hypothetical protein
MPPNLFSGLIVSGSSAAGLAAAWTTGAIAVKYPRPPEATRRPLLWQESPISVSALSRGHADDPWRAALRRFRQDLRRRNHPTRSRSKSPGLSYNWSLGAAHQLVRLVLVRVRRSLQQRSARVAGDPPAGRLCRDRMPGHAQWMPAKADSRAPVPRLAAEATSPVEQVYT